MKKYFLICFLLSAFVSACKKADNSSSNTTTNNQNNNSNKLCDGDGEANYFPLKSGNTWTYSNQYKLTGTVAGTVTHKGNTYYLVNYSDASNNSYSLTLRNDNQNTTLYYNAANDSEYAYIPAKPDTVYKWRFPLPNGKFGKRKVTSVSSTVTTSTCTYKAVEITQYDENGNAVTKYYYVKGLGEVRETTFAPIDLNAVVLE